MTLPAMERGGHSRSSLFRPHLETAPGQVVAAHARLDCLQGRRKHPLEGVAARDPIEARTAEIHEDAGELRALLDVRL